MKSKSDPDSLREIGRAVDRIAAAFGADEHDRTIILAHALLERALDLLDSIPSKHTVYDGIRGKTAADDIRYTDGAGAIANRVSAMLDAALAPNYPAPFKETEEVANAAA